MKWYLAPVSVALILLLSSPGHQKEQRSGSSRREGSGTPRREDSSFEWPSSALLDKLRKLPRNATFSDLAATLNLRLPSVPSHKKTVRMGGTLGVVDTTPSKIYCKTTRTCIPLPQPHDGSGIHWPFCAIVPQCSGCCDLMSNLLTCKPVRQSTHTVEVMYIPYAQTAPSFKQVPVKAHEQCACACRTDPSSCNANQFYKADHCRCECKSNSTKSVLNCKTPFKFSEDECRCKCSMPRSKCSSNEYWSDAACGCVCKPLTCGQSQTLNKKCECEDNMISVLNKFKFNWGRK